LATLGLAVDCAGLRARGGYLAIFSKMLLRMRAFTASSRCGSRRNSFDLRLRLRDAAIGLREVTLYTPLAMALGLGLSFLHLHTEWPGRCAIAGALDLPLFSSLRFPKSSSFAAGCKTFSSAASAACRHYS